MEPITGSRAYCVLRQECQEPIFCMSALNCAKMRSLSYQISAYRAGQNLHKQRGSQTVICPTVICPNSSDGIYYGIRSLLCAQIGVPGTYFLHKRIELCENALTIVPNILPIERGRICINSEVARLLSAQIAAMEPISGSGAYCVLRQECQEPIFHISALNCAKMLSLSYQISSYRAGQYLPIERGRIYLNSEVARVLSAQIAAMEPITGSRAYCVLRQECQEPIFCISALNCAKMRSLSYQISAYRAGQYLPIERGRICINSEVARLLSAQLLSAQIAAMEPITRSIEELIVQNLDRSARNLFSA